MPGKFLIDLTDPRFLIAANAEVMDFVRRVSPSAHGDVGSVLLSLGKTCPGAHAYSPSYRSFAYVVLHTDADRIFAIAFGQRGLAFRLGDESYAAARGDAGSAAPEIGPSWISFAPFDASGASGSEECLRHLRLWCRRAFTDAVATGLHMG